MYSTAHAEPKCESLITCEGEWSSASTRTLECAVIQVFARHARVRVLESKGAREKIVEGTPLNSRVRGLALDARCLGSA